jgi:hypothetical protein
MRVILLCAALLVSTTLVALLPLVVDLPVLVTLAAMALVVGVLVLEALRASYPEPRRSSSGPLTEGDLEAMAGGGSAGPRTPTGPETSRC